MMTSTVTRAPQRKRQFWLEHVKKWQRSGLSKAAYCQANSISAGSFYNWSRPVRSGKIPLAKRTMCTEQRLVSENAVQLVPLVTIGSPEPDKNARLVHIARADTTVQLPTELNPEQIQVWLQAIHQLHV